MIDTNKAIKDFSKLFRDKKESEIQELLNDLTYSLKQAAKLSIDEMDIDFDDTQDIDVNIENEKKNIVVGPNKISYGKGDMRFGHVNKVLSEIEKIIDGKAINDKIKKFDHKQYGNKNSEILNNVYSEHGRKIERILKSLRRRKSFNKFLRSIRIRAFMLNTDVLEDKLIDLLNSFLTEYFLESNHLDTKSVNDVLDNIRDKSSAYKEESILTRAPVLYSKPL